MSANQHEEHSNDTRPLALSDDAQMLLADLTACIEMAPPSELANMREALHTAGDTAAMDQYRDQVYQDRYQDTPYDDHYADSPGYRDGAR